jgi:hypothetical protein
MDTAEIAYAQALAYVWGRQDAGEPFGGYSIDFAAAFRDRRRVFDNGDTCLMPGLERAYTEWRDTQKIS